MIVMAQCRRDEWQPRMDWPQDCKVQWGRGGIVFSKTAGRSYTTAFFEAFPGAGGFLRGEGKTLDEAEKNAFSKHARHQDCASNGGHRYSRTRRTRDGKPGASYTNSAGFCVRCGEFQSGVFRPIVKLGECFKPLNANEVGLLRRGRLMAPRPTDDDDERKDLRWLRLKAKRAGIAMPEWEGDAESFQDACTDAVARYFAERYAELKGETGGGALDSLFRSFEIGALEEEARRRGYLPAEPDSDGAA